MSRRDPESKEVTRYSFWFLVTSIVVGRGEGLLLLNIRESFSVPPPRTVEVLGLRPAFYRCDSGLVPTETLWVSVFLRPEWGEGLGFLRVPSPISVPSTSSVRLYRLPPSVSERSTEGILHGLSVVLPDPDTHPRTVTDSDV